MREGWRGWLLPPALAIVAIALQLVIDVPHHPMEITEEPDEEGERTTTAARTPRPVKPRAKAYILELRKRWASRPITDEPVDPRFAEHHEDLLRAVIRKAEAAVVGNEELELQTVARCHTLRCELELCGDDARVRDAVAQQLPRVHVGRKPLWHELRELESAAEPAGDAGSCRRFLVDFAVEGANPRNLALRDPDAARDLERETAG